MEKQIEAETIKRKECQEIVASIREAKAYFERMLERLKLNKSLSRSDEESQTPGNCSCRIGTPEFETLAV